MSYPQPSGEFEWTQESWGAALQCRPLASVARHCFSTRELALEGVLAAQAPAWVSLARTLDVEPASLVRMHQVHCADVFEAHKANRDSLARGGYCHRRRPIGCHQRKGCRLRANPSGRPAKRRGCGGSCRLEGHGCWRGDGGRRRVKSAIRDERRRRDRRRRSEHRPVLLRGGLGPGGAILLSSGCAGVVLAS